ncbi:glutathione S-transferase N-terminal domain-containing protein [Teredinibacter turnerae]|uniref:glutathione S-transferase family protein n=1 Tax=Teredinibacter turnerae TaxID=2426 RepID=UPI000378A9AE|nr:glutathione S-transferase N-terminal domain-containing protein [Teredinibacter turnerae]
MLNFYMTPGSCSTGIHILLEELDLLFSAYVLNLPAGDTQKPDFLALNPKGTIPVLVTDEGVVLTEFASIAWWLAVKYPKAGLLPEDMTSQAQVLEILNYAVSTIHGHGFTRIFTPERYLFREEDKDGIIRQGKSLVSKGFNTIEKQFGGKTGYLFEQFTIADAALFYVEFWANRTELPLPPFCRQHFNTMISRPVVKRVLAEEGYRV